MPGIIRRKLLLMLLAVTATITARGQCADTISPAAPSEKADTLAVLPDSSNFVTASLLIISSTTDIYSVFGHTAFRMECPTHQLDYVFTLENDSGDGGIATFFAGKAKAYYVAVPTQQFLEDIGKEERSIEQYELNLSHHEKQELWRNLDNDMMEGAHRRFNLQNHCVSTVIEKLHQSLIQERMEWQPWQGVMLMNNGDLLRHYVRHSRWAEFLFMSFIGVKYEERSPQEMRISPERLPIELARATFVSSIDGTGRSVLTGKHKSLTANGRKTQGKMLSPTALFAVILLLVVLLTWGEWRWRHQLASRWLDGVLLVAQTLAGIVLLAIMFGSDVFGHCWNWYLIPFNPLPLLIWTCFHKQKNFGRIYIIYTVVLAAFIALTPFISQLDVPHQLLVVTLAVRCLSKYLEYKKNIK